MDPNPRPALTGRLLVGLLFIAGGLLFTAANLGFLRVHDVWRFWPLVLIGIGLLRFVSRNYFAGFIFITIGGLLQAREMNLLWFRLSMLFPLIFVLIGLNIVAEHWRRRSLAAPGGGAPGGTLSEWAVFGGGKRRIQSQEFRGGQANAMFGGFEIDLREAQMAGDSAAIDVFCFCGGGEIRVPESWNVSMKAVAIFGGQDDRSRPPAPGTPQKELVITGFILFGGLGIKN
jgi:hypothetical protein